MGGKDNSEIVNFTSGYFYMSQLMNSALNTEHCGIIINNYILTLHKGPDMGYWNSGKDWSQNGHITVQF